VGKAADLAVGLRRFGEIEVAEGMRFEALRLDAEGLEQVLADQVRRPAARAAHAKVHARLAEMDRQQLGVAIREVQEMHIAVARQVVEPIDPRPALGGEQLARVEGEAGRRGGGEDLQELSAVHGHVGGPKEREAWRGQASRRCIAAICY
jgi:hypothetical protein